MQSIAIELYSIILHFVIHSISTIRPEFFIHLDNKAPNISTTDLIAQLRKGNETALAILYDRYSGPLLGQIYNVIGDREVSEEVLQQTMMKIWSGIGSYDESKGGLFAWMCRIARNAAIDKGRLKSFQKNQKTESLQPYVYEIEDRETSTSGLDVERLTKNLDLKYKAVLDHVYLMGYTQAETAEILEIPLGTVKTRLRSAISRLRDELQDEKGLFIGILVALLLILLMVL